MQYSSLLLKAADTLDQVRWFVFGIINKYFGAVLLLSCSNFFLPFQLSYSLHGPLSMAKN